jgi:ethanolamine-phosphate cytidylyltransferase
MDGCFDLMHYGHANALRQARALGDQLVVGLVPDSEIRRCKGPPLMNEAERLEVRRRRGTLLCVAAASGPLDICPEPRLPASLPPCTPPHPAAVQMVESVKWVDEVITGVPYDLTPAFLERLIHEHKIDYVIHGDDPCLLPDGTDAYAYAKKAGRFRVIKRTEGVSTTDIVGRMLMCSRDNARFAQERAALTREFSRGAGHRGDSSGSEDEEEEAAAAAAAAAADSAVEAAARGGETPGGAVAAAAVAAAVAAANGGAPGSAPVTPRRAGLGGRLANVTVSRFMPTSRRIVQFSSGKSAGAGARIVYIDGAFDLFHVGHVQALKV